MTNGPKLRTDGSLLPGILAVALFGVLALVTLNTGFEGEMTGFEGVSVVSEIGYAMFDLEALQTVEGTEPFLASFILAAIVLDAALDAALVLAKREEAGEPVTALSSTSSTVETESGSGPDATGTGPGPAATDGGEFVDSSKGGDDA